MTVPKGIAIIYIAFFALVAVLAINEGLSSARKYEACITRHTPEQCEGVR